MDKKIHELFRENTILLLTILSAFASVLVYGEKRLEMIEASARADLKETTINLENKITKSNDDRRDDIKEINRKLDSILQLLVKRK